MYRHLHHVDTLDLSSCRRRIGTRRQFSCSLGVVVVRRPSHRLGGLGVGRILLKRLGAGQPPSFPWHARPQSHEIQDFLSNLGFSKEFRHPCLSHDTILRPRQEMKVYVDKENM